MCAAAIAVVTGGDNPLDSAAAVLAGVPVVSTPPATAAESSEGASIDVESLVGSTVLIVGRPELWLRERRAHVHSWDAVAERYMVLLEPAKQLGGKDAAGASPSAQSVLPMLLRKEHVQRVRVQQNGE